MARKYFAVWRTTAAHSGKIPDSAWEKEPYSRHLTLDAAQKTVEKLVRERRARCGPNAWDENYGITADWFWV